MDRRKRLHSLCFSDSELDATTTPTTLRHYASLHESTVDCKQVLPSCVYTSNPDILEFAVPCMHLDDEMETETAALRAFLAAQPEHILLRSTSVCCLRTYLQLPVAKQTELNQVLDDTEGHFEHSCESNFESQTKVESQFESQAQSESQSLSESQSESESQSDEMRMGLSASSDSDEDIHKDCQYAGEEQEASETQVLQSDSVLHSPKLMQEHGYYSNELALANDETARIHKRYNAQPMVAFDMYTENVYPDCTASQPVLHPLETECDAEIVIDDVLDPVAFDQRAFPHYTASGHLLLYDTSDTNAQTQLANADALWYEDENEQCNAQSSLVPYWQLCFSRKRTVGERCQSKFRLTIYVERTCGIVQAASTRTRKCPRFSWPNELSSKRDAASADRSVMDASASASASVTVTSKLQLSETVTYRFPLDWQQRSKVDTTCPKAVHDPPIRLLVASCQKPQHCDGQHGQSAWKTLRSQRCGSSTTADENVQRKAREEQEELSNVNELVALKKVKNLNATRTRRSPKPNGKCEAWLDNVSPAKVADGVDTDSGVLSSSSTTLLTCRSLGDLQELHKDKTNRTKPRDSDSDSRVEKRRTSSLPRLAILRQRKEVHSQNSRPDLRLAPAWENMAEAELNYLRNQTDQILDTISSVSSSLQQINGDVSQDSLNASKTLGDADLLEALAAEKARIDAVGKKIAQDTQKSREMLLLARSNIDALKKELESHANKTSRNLADCARQKFLNSLDSEKRNWLLERQSERNTDPLPQEVPELKRPEESLRSTRYPVRFRDALRQYETAINTELECLRERMQCLKFQAQI